MIKKIFEYIVEPLKWMWLRYKNKFGDGNAVSNAIEFSMINAGACFFFFPFFAFFFAIVFSPSIFIMKKVEVLTGFHYNSSSLAAFTVLIIIGLITAMSYSLGVRTTRYWGRKIKNKVTKKCDEDLKKQGEKMDLKLQQEAEARKAKEEKNG